MARGSLSVACVFLLASVWLICNRQTLPTVGDSTGKLPVSSVSSAIGEPLKPAALPATAAEPAAVPATSVSSPVALPAVKRSLPITADFIRSLASGPEAVTLSLPDGRTASGTIEQRHIAADGSLVGVTGRLDAPGKGTFHFRVQPAGAPTGPVIGAVVMDNEATAFRVMPGAGQTCDLTELPVDQVICRSYVRPPEEAETDPEEIPVEHPTNIPIPAYQNGVIPLQSRPGAVGVIYLDFDGQEGPHESWSNFDAASPNATNSQIKDVWTRVCEDYAPFNINVTTDLQIYLNAPETSRQRCIITPTTTAAPGAGGVAYVGSFGWSGDTPCWSYYWTGKNAAEVIAHEIGHTLGLSHDGRSSPAEDYYLGHGTDPVGWAPIMGAGYYKNLSQWSKGEYLSANLFQDDVAIIAANTNVGYRTDDAGATHAAAATLEIFSGGTVDSEGVIETRTDVDAFRFTTTGGAVNLAVSPVAACPDLDILASLYDANNVLVVSNNPDTAINATLATTLAAGDYTVRVDGVGRGSALADGYTDYGSLGQYTITGTITGALVPDRFAVAENSAAGTAVGTPAPRNNHAGATLTYSITGGNTGSAFAIDSATGSITVATPSVLNFEALSASWVSPPTFNLTVSIADPVNSTLNESLRVVVSVTNLNEPPVFSASTSITAISHTITGTSLGTVAASDPDTFDFPGFSIVAGNSAGKFAITTAGEISAAADLDASLQSSYALTIRATDQATPALTADQVVMVTVIPAAASYTPGVAYHTIYDGISGSTVANLTGNAAYPTAPTREVPLSSFTDTTQGDTYGSTVRAWLIAPMTGSYQFWIAGDDSADLYLSTAGNPAGATRICYLTSASTYQQWTRTSTQQSASFSLTAGQVCYIEARHKESTTTDHLSVAWQIKDPPATTTLVARQVIPGRYLSPHVLNYAPKVTAAAAGVYRNAYAGSTVATASATDLNPGDTRTWAITAGNSAGIFAIDPATGRVTVANAAALAANVSSSVALTLTATDNGAAPLSGSGSLTVTLLATSSTPTAGLIQEFWDGISGSALSSLDADARYPNRPDHLADLASFDSGTGLAENYGARIRAYLIPPTTGSYTFYISGDDSGSLLLSPDSNSANASQIASLSSFTSYQTWSTYASQTSTAVNLTAGQRYFIEARVKEATGGDHLSVGWTGPGISAITVIPDANTEPYDSNVAPEFSVAAYSFGIPTDYAVNTPVGTVTAVDSPFEEIRYAIVSGDPQHAFSIHSATGEITVAAPSNLSAGRIYQLQVGAQDSGHGRHFVPRETFIPVTVTAPGTNTPPQFSASPIALGSFPAGQAISTSIASYVTDPGDVVTFSLVSGPAWLSLSSGGVISGTSTFNNFGPYLLTVAANDGNGNVVQGTVTLTVSAPANLAATSLTASNATSAAATLGTVNSGTSASASVSDNAYLILREASGSGTSSLDYRWTFATTPNRPATLRIEAQHSPNTEGDDFQFSVSTNGGTSFSNAILVTKTADNNTAQTFAFTTGPGGSTIIKVVDTNRSGGKNNLDTLSIDLLAIDLPGNSVPVVSDATFQIASNVQTGVVVGNVAATDPDASQSLTYTLSRGNEAGLFAISPTGSLSVADTIPAGSGPFSLIVVATDSGTPSLANYATITVNVETPLSASITLENLTPTYDGSPHSVLATTNPAGLPVTLTYNGSSTPPVNAGSYAVNATVVDPIYTGSASATLVIAKAPAEISLAGLAATYDGAPKSATATTTPAGLTVDFTYGGLAVPPTAAGSYPVLASINSTNYTGETSATLVIEKAPATITFAGISQSYDGLPKSVTAITSPAGLAVDLTYDGSPALPVHAGSYTIAASINDLNFTGSAGGTFEITKASATITLGGLSGTFDGTPQTITASTSPPGLAVNLTYNGLADPPVHAGSYAIVATITDPDFTGTTNGTLEIAKAAATITLGDLTQTFDDSQKPATITTDPAGLAISVTYDGLPDPPTHAGSYPVVAMITDPDFTGTTSGTLEIAKATATITLGDLSQTFDSTPKPVTATTDPAGLAISVTYDDSPDSPVHAGSYAVVATITDPDFTGTTSGALEIAKAVATVTLDDLSRIFDGSPKPVTVTTTPANLVVEVTYDNSPAPPAAAGSYTVVASVTDPDYSGSSSGTLVIGHDSLIVAAGETFVIPDATSTYQSLLDEGTVVFRAGTLHITGDATNHGILRLVGDATLDIAGTFTNTGVIDIINWNGTLPEGLVNTGTILDRSALRVLATAVVNTTFSLSVPGFEGHLYQLETTATPADPWVPVGSPVPGTGSAAAPPPVELTAPLDGPKRLYRVVVTPAP